MTLKEYLSLIVDDDVRIEIEIETKGEDDYQYKSFWLSDFRVGCLSEYSEWTVKAVFCVTDSADLTIQIKP